MKTELVVVVTVGLLLPQGDSFKTRKKGKKGKSQIRDLKKKHKAVRRSGLKSEDGLFNQGSDII